MISDNIAIYPGSFDPITNGHVDLVKRTLRVFDRIIVAIATNPDKDHSLFTVTERLQMPVRAVQPKVTGQSPLAHRALCGRSYLPSRSFHLLGSGFISWMLNAPCLVAR